MLSDKTIGFIGGGNMGEALIKGAIQAGLLKPEQIRVFDISQERVSHLKQNYGIIGSSDHAELVTESQMIVLAVKPQNMPSVLQDVNPHLSHGPLIISIAAGIPLATLMNALPHGSSVIRVMPNTPALVLESASALARGPQVNDHEMGLAMMFFNAVGKTVEVEEKWMDAVTGLSGSGPAFILLIIEALIDGGVLMGLPRAIAQQLVLQTVMGTAKMVQQTASHPAQLKDLITSPGGTTIAGLHILEQQGVRGAVMAAVQSATLRSQELDTPKNASTG